MEAHQLLLRSLRTHSRLAKEAIREISSLRHEVREFRPGEDVISQGQVSTFAAIVVSGMVARYHLLDNGRRQYLAYHLPGDLPDFQALFLREMDHGVCAIGPATVAFVPLKMLMRAFSRTPSLAFAVWRETLIDAAIFREAITSNGARSKLARMAHLFCELFYRARQAKLTDNMTMVFPASMGQLGESLGMAIATAHRTLQELRRTQSADFREGELAINDWVALANIGEFDPAYLHSRDPIDLSSEGYPLA